MPSTEQHRYAYEVELRVREPCGIRCGRTPVKPNLACIRFSRLRCSRPCVGIGFASDARSLSRSLYLSISRFSVTLARAMFATACVPLCGTRFTSDWRERSVCLALSVPNGCVSRQNGALKVHAMKFVWAYE